MGRRRKYGPDGQPLPAEAVTEGVAVADEPRVLARIEPPASIAEMAVSAKLVKQMVDLVEQVGREVMREGVDWGPPYPGSDKRMLYQSGAQILDLTFRFNPTFEILEIVRQDSYIEVIIRCSIVHIPTSNIVATAIGGANSLEDKYQKTIATRRISAYDLVNTLIKQAQKRAHVSATINATAASRIYAPDMEELEEAAAAKNGGVGAVTAAKMDTGGPAAAPAATTIDVVPRLSDGQHAAILERMARLGQSTGSAQFKGWLADNYQTEEVKNLTVMQAEHVLQRIDSRLAKQTEAAANKVAAEMGVKKVQATTTATKE